jgi:hypothetical protein
MDVKAALTRVYPWGVSLFGSAIFLDSLRYKFTDHPNTQVIFGALDGWAATLGAAGLFSHTGLFSQYVIGTAELAASSLLLVGLIPGLKRLQILGAAVGFAVMTGAVNFHLWTPLGIDPNNDGGGLFAAACALWALTLSFLVVNAKEGAAMLSDLGRVFVRSAPADAKSALQPAH